MAFSFPASRTPVPPYVHQDYPAWVTLSDGRYLIVDSPDHQAALEAEIAPPKRQKTLTLPHKEAT
jgi:hypothetical protein